MSLVNCQMSNRRDYKFGELGWKGAWAKMLEIVAAAETRQGNDLVSWRTFSSLVEEHLEAR